MDRRITYKKILFNKTIFSSDTIENYLAEGLLLDRLGSSLQCRLDLLTGFKR